MGWAISPRLKNFSGDDVTWDAAQGIMTFGAAWLRVHASRTSTPLFDLNLFINDVTLDPATIPTQLVDQLKGIKPGVYGRGGSAWTKGRGGTGTTPAAAPPPDAGAGRALAAGVPVEATDAAWGSTGSDTALPEDMLKWTTEDVCTFIGGAWVYMVWTWGCRGGGAWA